MSNHLLTDNLYINYNCNAAANYNNNAAYPHVIIESLRIALGGDCRMGEIGKLKKFNLQGLKKRI